MTCCMLCKKRHASGTPHRRETCFMGKVNHKIVHAGGMRAHWTSETLCNRPLTSANGCLQRMRASWLMCLKIQCFAHMYKYKLAPCKDIISRGESGWCLDWTSTPGAWRHAGVRFPLSGGRRKMQKPYIGDAGCHTAASFGCATASKTNARLTNTQYTTLTSTNAGGHTASNAPELFRPPKLSGARPG